MTTAALSAALPPDEPPTSAGHIFTLAEAAAACQVAERTVRRRLPLLADHGATRNPDGSWSIPLGALLAVGFTPGRPTPPDEPDESPASAATAAALADRVAALEVQLVQARADVLVAEAHRQAAERVATLAERALLMLETARPAPADSVTAVTKPRSRFGRWFYGESLSHTSG